MRDLGGAEEDFQRSIETRRNILSCVQGSSASWDSMACVLSAAKMSRQLLLLFAE